MLDFMVVSTRSTKRGTIEIYPKFLIKKSTDLMIRGGDFYAIWIEERGLWSTDEQDALQLIDRELDRYAEENRQRFNSDIKVLHMWDAESGMIDSWHKYCQKQLRDSFHTLDDKLIFSNTETTKKDYASKRLNYPLEEGDLTAYEKLISTLYSPEERMKIEWAIGSIVCGESQKLQKFLVLYGAAGTGKSTILNIIQQLFEGYYSVFDAKALGSSSNSFALEAFKSNPLVAIQHDGDLSRIEDNTRLNSLVSHELMTVNEKFKSTYANRFKCFLFMGTNKPVRITDAKSGLIRRLIDVSPSGKQSLKKWEIELSNMANDPHSKMDDEVRALCKKIKHHELGLPWDQPVPEELWTKVAEYCDDDVIATEATYKANLGDFVAREILAELANGSVNDTTNSLTTKFIFGKNRNPQSEFMYRDLSEPVTELPDDVLAFLKEAKPEMMAEPFHGPKGDSLLPYFPDYRFENGKSLYRGEEVGEGGEVWAAPGMYGRSETEDVGSMHPNSAISECLFGPDFTKRFKDILDIRIYIKHGDFDMVRDMFEGALAKYLDDTGKAKALAQALKIAINSVYGLTAAGFMNAFRDSRNKDNIVAKRGALFMIDLRHEVETQGYKVIHIKTDSIKIENPDDYILDFICKYGKRHGYDFEVEHIFDRICLVNNAVYVAKLADDDPEKPGTWTATGTQFQIPYVFKCLFSKEDIKFEDMCETKSVSGSLYLDLNEDLPDVSQYEKEFSKAESDFKKGLLSDTTFESTCQKLNPLIAEGHNYRFIGKVGQFCPIKDGCGGGLLMREKDGKYYAATGTKGYRWLESEMVRELDKVDDIDRSYYDKLVNEAVDTISQYGDFEMFVSDDPFITEKKQNTPKLMPCGDAKYATCFDCPHFNDDAYHMDCEKNYDISEVISSQVMNPPVETK